MASSCRIIRTFEFEELPEKGNLILETATSEALAGDRTGVTIHSVFRSLADRDGLIDSDIKRGINESHGRMDELLARLKR